MMIAHNVSKQDFSNFKNFFLDREVKLKSSIGHRTGRKTTLICLLPCADLRKKVSIFCSSGTYIKITVKPVQIPVDRLYSFE